MYNKNQRLKMVNDIIASRRGEGRQKVEDYKTAFKIAPFIVLVGWAMIVIFQLI